MSRNHAPKKFFALGISYQTADARTRGNFSLDKTQIDELLLEAKQQGVKDLLVLNTCNRTELYGWHHSAQGLKKLLCRYSTELELQFDKLGHYYEEDAAYQHIFRVGTGLDSQILGDFEVIGQLKKSFYTSKNLGMANSLSERLVNAIIQASKRIKTETEISSGATSVAFASVQYILKQVPDIDHKKILLFGTGKIGRNTCENLVKHTSNKQITLINRTASKAAEIAGKFQLDVKPLGDLPAELRAADIAIIATGAPTPTISKAMIFNHKPLLILDLSVPKNVEEAVAEKEQVTLVHLDEMSKIADATLQRRQQYIPQALAIIEEISAEFKTWLEHRKYAPLLKAIKDKWRPVQDSSSDALPILAADVNKITGQIATYLKENPKDAPVASKLLTHIFELEINSDAF